jgi:transcriptional regulator with XRE-family HTH domain
MDKTIPKPLGKNYIENPTTLGQQLRNRRLELRLSVKAVAGMIGVKKETITNWEYDRTEPYASYSARIVAFLGYNPFHFDASTLAGKLKTYRYRNGFSQEKAGKVLGLDETTIRYIELGRNIRFKKTWKKLNPVMQYVTTMTERDGVK